MRSIESAVVYESLLARLARLSPDAPARWGVLSAAEMLAHLGDANESVLGIRVPPGPPPSGKPKRVMKWLALKAPLRWPKGVQTRAGVDPKRDGTRPGVFDRDRERVLASLAKLRSAAPGTLLPNHVMFGPMSDRAWRRWAYLHHDHHLRQFGC